MPDLEERTIADLPQRCENCGATLTDAEKSLALERGSSPVLCTICAAEQEPAADPAEEVGLE
ncbi:MAG TPA: hypothetical protein VK326_03615 [Solirubrobacterales bacterium]|nr:hypothetical protein [Solirubrobacterales bacterium]